MAFSLFNRQQGSLSQRERLDQLERRLVDSFRQLSAVMARAAELIEARRLERQGFERPDAFLERTDKTPR